MTTICCVGLGHLGVVFAASLADLGHDVRGWDSNESVLAKLRTSIAPVREPGLDDLLLQNQTRLRYFASLEMAVHGADIVWLTTDTPIRSDGTADLSLVESRAMQAMLSMSDDALFVSSSQLPVGTMDRLVSEWSAITPNRPAMSWRHVAIVPENLRLCTALNNFDNERWIIGAERKQDHEKVAEVLTNGAHHDYVFCSRAEAECTKHFRNAWLAMNVAFGNEMAGICAKAGADATVVAKALKVDPRIGKAPILPGGAYAGGHLARDMTYLQKIAATQDVPSYLLTSVEVSNRHHSLWTYRTLLNALHDDLRGKTIAVLGVAFKSGTADTTDSPAFALGDMLAGQGAILRYYDPLVTDCYKSAVLACQDASAVVVLQNLNLDSRPSLEQICSVGALGQTVIIDPNGYCRDTLDDPEDFDSTYYCVGKAIT